MQLHEKHVSINDDVATPLLDGEIVVPPIKRVEVDAARHAQLEAHLRGSQRTHLFDSCAFVVREGLIAKEKGLAGVKRFRRTLLSER
jgi:hypothetical protein